MKNCLRGRICRHLYTHMLLCIQEDIFHNKYVNLFSLFTSHIFTINVLALFVSLNIVSYSYYALYISKSLYSPALVALSQKNLSPVIC